MPITMTDQALVFAARNGNAKCFEELYKRYYDKIYALARGTMKNDADAEDVLQSTFIKAWQSLRSLEDPAAFNTWLQHITLNECYSLMRKSRPTLSMEEEGENGEMLQLESDLMLPQEYAERSDLSQRLGKIVGELSDVQRETILLYYYEEMSVEEIAQAMDCSAGTVKSRLFLARKAIKTEIEEQERKTGQKFYSVVPVPLAGLLVKLVRDTMIPQAKAMSIYGRGSHVLFGTPLPVAAVSGAVQAAASARRAAAAPTQPSPAAPAQTAAAAGLSAPAVGVVTAAAAAKAGFPLWAKLSAGLVAAAIAVTGGFFGIRALTRGSASSTDASRLAADTREPAHTSPSEGAEPSQTDATEPAETLPPEIELEAVDPSTLPESLSRFLMQFNFGYFTTEGTREYDCSAPNQRLISLIAGNGSCVSLSLYPAVDVEENWNAESDPLSRYEYGSYISFNEAGVLRVAEQIFHVDPDSIPQLLQSALDSSSTLYEYEQDGETRLCNFLGGVGGPGFEILYNTVKTDGERYYIIYDCQIQGMPGDKETYYAEMSEITVDGVSYWTMYRHTEELPNLNRIVIPKGYDDAYLAFIDELNEQYLPIFGAETYDHSRYTAICDVCGDETPELIYWTSENGEYSYKKYLHILSYENGALKTLYRSTGEDYVMAFMLYQAAGSKKLYLFDYQPVVDSGHTIISSFEESAGALRKTELVCYTAAYNMDNPPDYHYDYLWRADGAEVSEEVFTQKCEALLGQVDQVLMRSSLVDYESRFSGLNNLSLTVEEAIDRLYAALGEARPSESPEEIFSRFAGDYLFTSGIGGWGTRMTLGTDGSFSGTFTDDDYVRGDGYEMTQLHSDFQGRFSNPRRINYYTYAFTLETLRYEREPGTSELTTLYGSTPALVNYTTAYGLEGSTTVYAYTKDAYMYALPDAFLSWTKGLRDVEGYSSRFGYNGLFTEEGQQGWICTSGN